MEDGSSYRRRQGSVRPLLMTQSSEIRILQIARHLLLLWDMEVFDNPFHVVFHHHIHSDFPACQEDVLFYHMYMYLLFGYCQKFPFALSSSYIPTSLFLPDFVSLFLSLLFFRCIVLSFILPNAMIDPVDLWENTDHEGYEFAERACCGSNFSADIVGVTCEALLYEDTEVSSSTSSNEAVSHLRDVLTSSPRLASPKRFVLS